MEHLFEKKEKKKKQKPDPAPFLTLRRRPKSLVKTTAPGSSENDADKNDCSSASYHDSDTEQR